MLLAVRGERSFRRRLLELGFLPGTPLRMVRRVDVGDILEVDLRHSRVSLRLSEARGIEVDISVAPAVPAAVSAGAPAAPPAAVPGLPAPPAAVPAAAPRTSPFAGGPS